MKNQLENSVLLKILFIGNGCSGKSSLIQRQVNGKFSQNWMITIGVDFRIKYYDITGINVKAQLWDSYYSGDRFRSIGNSYFRGAQAINICFDLNDHQSFQNVQYWLKQSRQHIPTQQIFLVGCKSDLEHKVSKQQIQKFSLLNGIVYFQTSSKQGKGVNQFMKFVVSIVTPKKILQSKNIVKLKPIVNKPRSWFECC